MAGMCGDQLVTEFRSSACFHNDFRRLSIGYQRGYRISSIVLMDQPSLGAPLQGQIPMEGALETAGGGCGFRRHGTARHATAAAAIKPWCSPSRAVVCRIQQSGHPAYVRDRCNADNPPL